MRTNRYLFGSLAALLLLVSSLGTQTAVATVYTFEGPIWKLVSLDRVSYGTNPDSVLVSGFTSAGSCVTNDGHVAVAMRDDDGGRRQIALLMMAKVSGVEVHVRVDDSIKNAHGACYLQVLEVAD